MSLPPQLEKIIRITGLDREFHVDQRDPAGLVDVRTNPPAQR
jgi:hypothetical protein